MTKTVRDIIDRGRRATREERVAAIRQLAKRGLTRNEIAEMLGWSYGTVARDCQDERIATSSGY